MSDIPSIDEIRKKTENAAALEQQRVEQRESEKTIQLTHEAEELERAVQQLSQIYIKRAVEWIQDAANDGLNRCSIPLHWPERSTSSIQEELNHPSSSRNHPPLGAKRAGEVALAAFRSRGYKAELDFREEGTAFPGEDEAPYSYRNQLIISW